MKWTSSISGTNEAPVKSIVLFLFYQLQNQIPSTATDALQSDDSALSSSGGGPGKLVYPLFNINWKCDIHVKTPLVCIDLF